MGSKVSVNYSVARERLRLLESVFVNGRDAVMITLAEPAGESSPHIVFVNSAFTDLTGYSWDDVIGKAPAMLQGPQTSAEAREQIRNALETWQPLRIDLLNYRKDGSSYWVESDILPIADQRGRCTHWVSIQRDLTGRIADEAALVFSSTHDALTGLGNRSYFVPHLRRALQGDGEEWQREKSLILVDIDRFELVNGSFGHRVGDLVLAEAAARLRLCTSSSDVVARMGGDEFVILLEAGHESDALIATELIAKQFEVPFDTGTGSVSLTLSIGVISFSGGYWDAETLLRNVDTAMYCAKQEGGNRCVTFASSMETQANDVLRIHSDLRNVVERDELRIYYQPLVDVSAGRVYGFEALVRWQHPERGLLRPIDFIALAEETAAIARIDSWVCERACRAGAAWPASSDLPLSISVNVSSRELLDPSFFTNLNQFLERSQLPPPLLQIEITESVFLAEAAVIGRIFEQIRALGVKIALDDFGTGYSSLSYLERFQIDVLKIDRSFVSRISDPSAKSEIVRMIVSLAHALGVEVVAEGIEMRAQRDALFEMGCTKMQGFLFGRPIPEAEIAALVRSNFAGNSELQDVFGGSANRKRYSKLSGAQHDALAVQLQSVIELLETCMTGLERAVATGEWHIGADYASGDDACTVGQWLADSIDRELRKSPHYAIAKARHAAFHRSAARLRSLALAHDPAALASLEPGGDFTAVASLMRQALDDWLALVLRMRSAPPTLLPAPTDSARARPTSP